MQRNYKLIVSIFALALTSLGAFAQDEVEYKDVILDGKPAKLNVVTGEITLVSLDDKKKSNTPAEKQKPSKEIISSQTTTGVHVVQEGETLFDISKYYNVPLNKLKQVNNLETTLINKGQVLRVKFFEDVSYSESQPKPETSYAKSYKTDTTGFHNVESGETLFSLAKRYNISLSELKSLNNLNSNLITVGQRLRINDFTASDSTNTSDYNSTWTVSKGDTLFSIANKNGTTVDAIKQLNGLTSNTILVGQKLQIK